MGAETHLWLIRHAPVDGPRGVIHGPDAPADLSDAGAFAALVGSHAGDPLAGYHLKRLLNGGKGARIEV